MRTVRFAALIILAPLAFAVAALADGTRFRVTLPADAREPAAAGRLVVSVVRPNAKLGPGQDPNNAPFWSDPQPMFGLTIAGLKPGESVTLDNRADHNFEKLAELTPGTYRAAARLISRREHSDWRATAGNLFSQPVTFTIAADGEATVDLALTGVTRSRDWPGGERAGGAELVEIRSTLLSDFHNRDIFLRAGVVKPTGFDPAKSRKYPAVYEVPGFGGDHFEAISMARRRGPSSSRVALGDAAALDAATFWIVLDPESPNGHTLFADSANNGPCARALIEELIPAIEARYPLVARPEARLLRGHSSGGWSTLWLALNYPETFGAAWSSAPDPVDFRRFQRVNIYEDANAYTDRDGREFASYRQGGDVLMTVRQEARSEDILGPDNTSGQQWDSWFAVWGPRNERGNPAALFDPATGAIDRAVAEQYRRYDIGHLLRTHPDKYRDPLQKNIRLVVGGADNFFLNEAVELLKQEAAKLPPRAHQGKGYIKVLPDLDHGSVFGSSEVRAFPGEMLEHLRAHQLAP